AGGLVEGRSIGDAGDPTRNPAIYDETFDFLRGTGVPIS
ncbi:MAG: hypothetical protein RLZZ522_1610, partial [Verrucomicrobiota bacterium]